MFKRTKEPYREAPDGFSPAKEFKSFGDKMRASLEGQRREIVEMIVDDALEKLEKAVAEGLSGVLIPEPDAFFRDNVIEALRKHGLDIGFLVHDHFLVRVTHE